jgi:hypothetical protein
MGQQIQKFCLIVDLVTYLVVVAGKEPSDLLVVRACSSARLSFWRRATSSSGCRRTKNTPFGWMQDGVFKLFDQEGRVYRWQTEEETCRRDERTPVTADGIVIVCDNQHPC